MAYVLNDPADFADELTAGFAAAYSDWVTQVDGGVVRASKTREGQVAVIIGGGSGHYPAFAGLVGPGLAHGAAMGNIFASPSAQQVYNIAKAAHAGGGVLLTYGNYAGDVLNFNQAQEWLIAEGIECKTVAVTDDIASAPEGEEEKRRGIAGDLFVFKVSAAAAEAGKSLDEVAEVASLANSRVRSLGVAFTGCTLPGAAEPLFTVPKGRMGVGMGIHGEAGIDEQDIPTSHELAKLLVDRVLAEAPDDPVSRVVVLVNGLGGVKYEELFVLYGSVAQILDAAGFTIVQPDVGELVTSFEMAGVSLTIAWLTDELEEYWAAPVNTPAYRKGSRDLGERRTIKDSAVANGREVQASAESQAAAGVVSELLGVIQETIDNNVERLGELDAIAGDGDHGIGMQRGARAAAETARELLRKNVGAATLLTSAADAWAERAGGTSGALWRILLRGVGEALSDAEAVTASALSKGVLTAAESVQSFGKAEVGDKTMVDAIVPFAEVFAIEVNSGGTPESALSRAAQAADDAAKATADMPPRIGRARPHVEKSLGTPDPGAVSFALISQALAKHTSAQN